MIPAAAAAAAAASAVPSAVCHCSFEGHHTAIPVVTQFHL